MPQSQPAIQQPNVQAAAQDIGKTFYHVYRVMEERQHTARRILGGSLNEDEKKALLEHLEYCNKTIREYMGL